MARAVPRRHKIMFAIMGWSIGLALFFPILWTALTSFKTEGEAIVTPPSLRGNRAAVEVVFSPINRAVDDVVLTSEIRN